MLQGISYGYQYDEWAFFNNSGDGSYNILDHVAQFDGPTRTIWILNDISEVLVKEHLYSDWKEWVGISDNTKWLQAFETEGGRPISATERLGDSYLLINDWIIRQKNSSTNVNVRGNLYAYNLAGDPKDPYGDDPNGNRSINSTVSNIVNTVGGSVATVDYNQIASAVWDAVRSNYVVTGTMGEQMSNIPSTQNIVNGVWDEQTSAHTITGSTGEAVAAGGTGGSPDIIADAVWDKATSTNQTAGTRGAESTLSYEESKRARQMQTNKVDITRLGAGTGQVDTISVYDDDGITLLYTITVTGEDCDNRAVTYTKPY